MSKLHVHTVKNTKARIIVDGTVKTWEEREEHPSGGHCVSRRSTWLTAEYSADLEVYIDLDAIIQHYARVALRNKRKRFVRGPIEVRAVNVREVSKTRKEEGYPLPGEKPVDPAIAY